MHGRLACLCLAAAALAGCRWAGTPSPEQQNTGISLLEDRLLEVIELEKALDAAAAEPDAGEREIQRRFHRVAREYQGIVARNPDHLESRLLYGKLLSRYGDREGARSQFLQAARIDPQVAVIHQQLSTYYAEENDHTRALAYALNAIELEPGTAAYHFQLGQLLVAFREAFVLDGVFSNEKIDAELLNAFRTAAELEPDTLPLQFRYGEAFYDVADPDWESALAHWESLTDHPGLSDLQTDAVRLHQARCLASIGRVEEAAKLIEAVESPRLQPSAEGILENR